MPNFVVVERRVGAEEDTFRFRVFGPFATLEQADECVRDFGWSRSTQQVEAVGVLGVPEPHRIAPNG